MSVSTGSGVVGIENWSIVAGNQLTPYQAPELQTYKIRGEVHGHPGFEDGESVTTSVICERNGRFVETANTRYHLGYPSVDYLQWCHDHGQTPWFES
tara:strand:- start:203 stop:493 length:291 start_codon:yes stop_codon:yes gene_type:complete